MLRAVHDVENVLSDEAFWTALVIAGAGTAIVWLRLRRAEWEPGVAFVVAVAGLAGLRAEHRMPNPLVVAVVMLALGEYLTRDEGLAARVVGLVPGAVVLGASLPDGWPFWMRVTAAVAATLGGLLAIRADERAPRLVPPLLLIGAVGVYACVPDTEAPKVLLGALLAVAVLGLEPRLRHRCGAAALTGLFVWVATFGGLGRGGSVVGGIACLGVVVLLPLVPRWTPTRWSSVLAIVVQVAVVVYVSRGAGFEESAGSALLLSLAALAAGWVVLSAARGRRASPPSR
jgi:hypothetical protein